MLRVRVTCCGPQIWDEKMLFYCPSVCVFVWVLFHTYSLAIVSWLENACKCMLSKARHNDLRGRASPHRSYLICKLFVFFCLLCSVSASEVRRSRTKMDNYKHFVCLSDTLKIGCKLTQSYFSKSYTVLSKIVWNVISFFNDLFLKNWIQNNNSNEDIFC